MLSNVALLRFEATVTGPRDLGHLALYVTMLSGTSARHPIHLYIDLAGCASVNAAGVDLLVDLHRRLSARGGGVTLMRPSVQLRHRLQLVARVGAVPAVTDEEFV